MDRATKDWYQLKPDSKGSYANGTWTTLAQMGLERLFFPVNVLPSGKVFLVGGEYSGPNTDATFVNTGQIYDPVANAWTNIADFPKSDFGDDPTEVLPDGTVLAGFITGPETFIYNPSTNVWTQTGTKLRNDPSDEETWLKLPDGSILSYDIFSSVSSGVGHAQRYIPSQGIWVDAGTVPVPLSSSLEGFELGGAELLPDGRAFFLGATGNTAFYTPSTNTWTAGPVIPNGLVCADAPAAMLPNGHVLFGAAPAAVTDPVTGLTNDILPPTTIFEFDPVAGTYTDVTPDPKIFDLSLNPSFSTTMLVLPSGQVMLTNFTRDPAIYTPVGSPNDAWRPTISRITIDGNNTFTLTGTQLNGLSEGASYGDDNEMASNFPIVQLTDPSGNVFYARTFNWSNTGVATGNLPVTVQFSLPPGLAPGPFGVTVIANGIASQEVQTNLGDFRISDVSKLEGNSGLTDFVFTVTQPATNVGVTVVFNTIDGTAQAGSDYIAQTGTITFAPGQTSRQITELLAIRQSSLTMLCQHRF